MRAFFLASLFIFNIILSFGDGLPTFIDGEGVVGDAGAARPAVEVERVQLAGMGQWLEFSTLFMRMK